MHLSGLCFVCIVNAFWPDIEYESVMGDSPIQHDKRLLAAHEFISYSCEPDRVLCALSRDKEGVRIYWAAFKVDIYGRQHERYTHITDASWWKAFACAIRALPELVTFHPLEYETEEGGLVKGVNPHEKQKQAEVKDGSTYDINNCS